MKKVRWITIVLVLLTAKAASAETIKIGLAWAGKSEMAQRVTKGFNDGIRQLAPETEIEYKKQLASVNELAKTVKKWKTEKKGMVLLRSNAAKWLAANPPSMPTFIGACNHPVQLGTVKNLKSPEGNITGVTYYLSVDFQFEIYSAIIPELKSVLLLLEQGHPASVIDQSETKAICKNMHISYFEKFCSSLDDAKTAARQADGMVSAIVFGNQALLLDNAEAIIKAAGNTPVVSYASRPVKAGALGGFVADDFKLGYMLAEAVTDVLIKGKPVSRVPVKTDSKPKFVINIRTAQRLKIKIPFDILSAATIIE